ASQKSSRVITDCAISELQRADVEDATASFGNRVAAEGTIADRQNAATRIVDAAALTSHVAAKSAVNNGQRSRIEDAATKPRRVAVERAVNDRQRRGVGVQDGAAFAALTVPDRQAGNRHRFTCNSLEDATRGIAINCQYVSAGAVDSHALIHQQCPGGKCNHAGDTGGVDRIAVVCLRERLTHRARAAVVGVTNYDCRRSRGNCESADQCQTNYHGLNCTHSSHTVELHENCNCLKVTWLLDSQT